MSRDVERAMNEELSQVSTKLIRHIREEVAILTECFTHLLLGLAHELSLLPPGEGGRRPRAHAPALQVGARLRHREGLARRRRVVDLHGARQH